MSLAVCFIRTERRIILAWGNWGAANIGSRRGDDDTDDPWRGRGKKTGKGNETKQGWDLMGIIGEW